MSPAAVASVFVAVFLASELIGLCALFTHLAEPRRRYLLRIALICALINAALVIALIASSVAKYRNTRSITNSPVKVLTHVQSHEALPC